MRIKNFTDFDAWKKGHELVLIVYQITKNFPKSEIYGIISQMQRAATSITANIAEGFSRYHYKEKINFYYNARGSVSELENFTYVSRDIKYLSLLQVKNIINLCNDTRRLINGLIKSIQKQINK